MSHSQFDTPVSLETILATIQASEAEPGKSQVTIEGPLSTDPDRTADIATISIFVQILQTQSQTFAIGNNVIQGKELTRWSCPVTIQSGGFQVGSAMGIATTVEQYSNPAEHYVYNWTQKLTFK
jgi:hypothetical protein